ncbi:MAG: patatin-like phospholipase family protein, partial [Gammaproteobacteria bacterium]|nr:patatin-like phospholipase family protein [Gammaproteobacteria bacterium]
ISIALALGHSASEILSLYERNGPKIFGENQSVLQNSFCKSLKHIRWFYRNKYDSTALQIALQDVLGDQCIGHAQTRLVIPAWDTAAQSVYIYKTAHHSRLKTDHLSLAIDASMATAAAPTYFPQHITKNDVALIDGGVWANNPIAIAVVEAIGILGWKRSSLRVLSLGCLEETYTVPRGAGISHLWGKAYKLLKDGQSQGAIGMAEVLAGHGHNRKSVFRVSHKVPYNSYKMDDVNKISILKGLGHSKARKQLSTLKPIFFDRPVEEFIPVYKT